MKEEVNPGSVRKNTFVNFIIRGIKLPERYACTKGYGYLQIGLKKSDEKKMVLWETPMLHL